MEIASLPSEYVARQGYMRRSIDFEQSDLEAALERRLESIRKAEAVDHVPLRLRLS